MVPTSVSRAVSNACFGSGSDGRPAGSDGACSCSVDKTSMCLSFYVTVLKLQTKGTVSDVPGTC
jgi:hypothetical protein